MKEDSKEENIYLTSNTNPFCKKANVTGILGILFGRQGVFPLDFVLSDPVDLLFKGHIQT